MRSTFSHSSRQQQPATLSPPPPRCDTAPTSSSTHLGGPPDEEPQSPPYRGRMIRRGAVLQTGDAMMFPTSTDLALPENSNIPVNYVFPPDDDRDVQTSHRGTMARSERLLSPSNTSRGHQHGQQSLIPSAPKMKDGKAVGGAQTSPSRDAAATPRRTDRGAPADNNNIGALLAMQRRHRAAQTEEEHPPTTTISVHYWREMPSPHDDDAFGGVLVPPLRQPEALTSFSAPPHAEERSPEATAASSSSLLLRPSKVVFESITSDVNREDQDTSGLMRPVAPTTSISNSVGNQDLPTPPPTPAPLDGSAVTKAAAEIVCFRLQDDPDHIPHPNKILEDGLDPVAAGSAAGTHGDAVALYDAAFQTCLMFMSELAASKRNGGTPPKPQAQATAQSSAGSRGGAATSSSSRGRAKDGKSSSTNDAHSNNSKRSNSQRKRTAQVDDSATGGGSDNQQNKDNSSGRSSSSSAMSDLVNETERALLLHFFDPERAHNTLVQQWHTNHYDPAPATPHHVDQQRGRCASVAMETEWKALAVKVLLAKCPALKQQTSARKKSFRQLTHDELPPDETVEERGIRLLREEALLALDRAFFTETLLDDNPPELRTQQGKGPATLHTVANSPLVTINAQSYLDPIRGLHLYVWPSYAKAQYLYRVTQRVADATLLDAHVAGGVLRCPVMALYDICGLAVTVQPIPILEHGWMQSSLRVPLGSLRQGDLSLLSFACSQLLWHVSFPVRLFDVYASHQKELVLHRGHEGYLYLVNPEVTQDRGLEGDLSLSTSTGSPSSTTTASKKSVKAFNNSKPIKGGSNATPLNTSSSGRAAHGFALLKRGALVSVPSGDESGDKQRQKLLLSSVLGALQKDDAPQRTPSYMLGSTLLQSLVFSPKFSFRGLCDDFQLAYRPQEEEAAAAAKRNQPSRESPLPVLGPKADLEGQTTAFFRYVTEVAVPRVAQHLIRECNAARASVDQHFIYRHNTPEDKEEQSVIDMVRLGVFAQVMHEGNLPIEACALVLRCLNSGQFGDDGESSSAADATVSPRAAAAGAANSKAFGGTARRASTKNLTNGNSPGTSVPPPPTEVRWVKRSQRRPIEIRDNSDDEYQEEMTLDRLTRSSSFSAAGATQGGSSGNNNISTNNSTGRRQSSFSMENSSSTTSIQRKSSMSFSGSASAATVAGTSSSTAGDVTSPMSTTTGRLKRIVSTKIDEDAVLRRVAMRVVKTEMLGRTAKSILRVHLAAQGGPVSQHIHMQLLNRMRRLLHDTTTAESESFWKDTLIPLAKKKFHVATRDLAFVDRRHAPSAALVMRMMTMNPFIDPMSEHPPLRLHRLIDLEAHLRGASVKLKFATSCSGGSWMHTSEVDTKPVFMAQSDHNAVTSGTKEGPTLIRYCTKDSTEAGGFFGLIRAPTIDITFSVTPHVPYALSLLGCSTTLPPRLRAAPPAPPVSSKFDDILRQRLQVVALQRLGSVGRHAAWLSAYLLALRVGHWASLATLTTMFSDDTESLEDEIAAVKSDAVEISRINDAPSTGGTKTIALTSGVHQQAKLAGQDTSDMENTYKLSVLRRVEDGTLFVDDLTSSSILASSLYRAVDLFEADADDGGEHRDYFHSGIFGGKSCGHAEFSRTLGDTTLMLMSYDSDRLRRLAIDLDTIRFGGMELNYKEQSTAVVIHVMLQITKAVTMSGMQEFEGNDPNAPPPPSSTAVKAPAKAKGKSTKKGGKPAPKKGAATAGASRATGGASAAQGGAADHSPPAPVTQLPMRHEGGPMDTAMTTPQRSATEMSDAATKTAVRNETIRVVAAVADSARDEDVTKWSMTAFNLLIAEYLPNPEEIVDHVPMAHALIAIGDSLESRNLLQLGGFIRLLNEKFCATCRGTSRQDLIRRRSIALRALRSVTRQGKLLTSTEIFDALVGLLDDSVYRTYASGVEDYESDVSIQALLMVIVLGCGKVFDAPRTQCVRRILARLQSDNSRALLSLQDQLQAGGMGSMYWLFRRKDSLELLHKVLNFMEKKKSDFLARTRLKAFLDFHARQLVCTEMIQRIGVSYRVRKTLYPKFLDFDRIRKEAALAASIRAMQDGKILEHDQKLQRESGMKSEMAARALGEQAEAKQRESIMQFFLDTRPRDMFFPLLSLDPTKHDGFDFIQSTVLGMEPRPPSRARNELTFRRSDDDPRNIANGKHLNSTSGKDVHDKEKMLITIQSSGTTDSNDRAMVSPDNDGGDGINPTPPAAALLSGSMEDTWLEGFVLTAKDIEQAKKKSSKKRHKKVSPYGRLPTEPQSSSLFGVSATSSTTQRRAPLYVPPPSKAAIIAAAATSTNGPRAGGGGTASGTLSLTAPRVAIQT
ncbi:Hypothetical protein, putative [Bodo saltans]|uniref:Uncharacterized protein n=1 Tax=Bodo saltans TaxID=75058 RepID=A0A0S4J4I6_BODSA|nr:Hypothetical protein, putative [Bodo saltans]|eukprot:CUG18407.1 Hypothetical protein, putative [Bodo saltans]